MEAASSTIHASAALVGARAVLVRGPSGSGKSSLVLAVLRAVPSVFPFARLVADDRAALAVVGGRLVVRPAPALAGLLEARGLGILRLPYERAAIVGCVVDLGVAEAERLPRQNERETVISGVHLARLAVAHGADPLGLLRDFLDRAGFDAPKSP